MSTTTPLSLSLVTPTYNQAEFIKQTFDSILAQDISFPFQYVVMDGMSTDATPQIIAEYTDAFLAKGIDFVYIREKDTGQSNAINNGWKHCTGDIFGFLNSDDYYHPGALQAVMQYFSQPNAKPWAYGGWTYVTKTGKEYMTKQPTEYSRDALLNFCVVGQPSCFYRRELIEEFGGINEDLHLSLDYDLWLRFATKYEAGIIPQALSNMRYYADAKSGARTVEHLFQSYKVRTQYTKWYSWRRLMQTFHFCRGMALALLGRDITRRVAAFEER